VRIFALDIALVQGMADLLVIIYYVSVEKHGVMKRALERRAWNSRFDGGEKYGIL